MNGRCPITWIGNIQLTNLINFAYPILTCSFKYTCMPSGPKKNLSLKLLTRWICGLDSLTPSMASSNWVIRSDNFELRLNNESPNFFKVPYSCLEHEGGSLDFATMTFLNQKTSETEVHTCGAYRYTA